jgi:HEXXH motif-containing protein
VIAWHILPDADFDELACGMGGVRAVEALARGQYGKRLLQLRALFDAAGEVGLEDALEPGFRLLTAIQRTDPALVTDVFLHPPVGEWLAHCLRRLTRIAARENTLGGAGIADDLRYLSSIAAAAALRADADFVVTVTPYAGTVMLPTLGQCRLPGRHNGDPVTVRGRSGREAVIESSGVRLVLPADRTTAAPGWTPLRRFESDNAGLRLRVFLDDMDPFRDCQGSVTTGPLDPESAARWRHVLDEAWFLLTRHHPWYAQGIATGLRSIIPLCAPPGHALTATSADCFGSCLMSEPTDPAGMAVGLVHEFQHLKLGALMDLVALDNGDAQGRYYAPWRDDPRPLRGLLHGAYAFLSVTDFWRIQRSVTPGAVADFAHFEFARRREQVLHAVETLETSGRLTHEGVRLVAAIAARVHAWTEDAPPQIAEAARDSLADHRITWRLRHVSPNGERVRLFAAAWQASPGSPKARSPRKTPTRCDATAWDQTESRRLELLSLRLRHPSAFAALRKRCADRGSLRQAASDADIAYVNGDLDHAAAGYEHMLAIRPDSVPAWAGLALIRRHQRRDDPDALAAEPELVSAVYQRVLRDGGVPPAWHELADWLTAADSHSLTGTEARCQTATDGTP